MNLLEAFITYVTVVTRCPLLIKQLLVADWKCLRVDGPNLHKFLRISTAKTVECARQLHALDCGTVLLIGDIDRHAHTGCPNFQNYWTWWKFIVHKFRTPGDEHIYQMY